MSRIRLLYLVPTLHVGGAERHLAILAPALRDRGFDITVLALNRAGRQFDQLRASGISAHFIGMRSRYDVRAIRRVLGYSTLRPDVVATVSVNAQVLGHVIARRLRIPHLTIEHGGGEPLTPYRRVLVRLIATRADAVVTVSATQIPELLDLGYRADRIRVIPNGIPELVPSRPAVDVRAELGVAHSAFVALLLATLRPEKRADLFVDAVAAAHAVDPRIRGVVAGGGPLLSAIRGRASSGSAVRVLGERDDVADLVAASDVVCLSSAREGLPVAVLEAMALARPVLAPAVDGITEAVTHRQTGLLVQFGSPDPLARALVELAEDAVLATTLGRNGRMRYEERYTVPPMADAYADTLRALVTRSEHRSRGVDET